jgi:uncharacterized membrane protein YadS
LIKMMRVTMLVPVVIACTIFIKQPAGAAGSWRNPLPWFVILFAAFVGINSTGAIPPFVVEQLSSASRWCLIVGIAAMGMRTSFKDVLNIGGRSIALICIETVALAAIVLGTIRMTS